MTDPAWIVVVGTWAILIFMAYQIDSNNNKLQRRIEKLEAQYKVKND